MRPRRTHRFSISSATWAKLFGDVDEILADSDENLKAAQASKAQKMLEHAKVLLRDLTKSAPKSVAKAKASSPSSCSSSSSSASFSCASKPEAKPGVG